MKKAHCCWSMFCLAAFAAQAQEGGLTLAQARERALAHNPAFLSAQQEVQAARGDLRAAGAWGSPTLAFEREDFAASGPEGMPEPVETLSLSVPLPLGGRRGALRTGARSGVEAARAGLETARLDLLAQVETAFGEALGARDHARAAEESLRTAGELAEAVRALAEAGEVSPIEADRVGVELTRARIARDAALRRRDRAHLALAALLGLPRPDFAAVAGELPESVPLPEAEEGVERHPLLMRLDGEARRLAAEAKASRRGWWPEPELTFGARRYDEPGGHAFVAGLALSLPSPAQTAGAALAAAARERQGSLARTEGELQLRAALAAARGELQGALAEATALREEALPLARAVTETLSEGYALGRFGLLDLLEAKRALAEVRAQYIDALVALNRARAEWDRLAPASPSPEAGVTP